MAQHVDTDGPRVGMEIYKQRRNCIQWRYAAGYRRAWNSAQRIIGCDVLRLLTRLSRRLRNEPFIIRRPRRASGANRSTRVRKKCVSADINTMTVATHSQSPSKRASQQKRQMVNTILSIYTERLDSIIQYIAWYIFASLLFRCSAL